MASEIALRDSQLEDTLGKIKAQLKRIEKSDKKQQVHACLLTT